MFLHVTRVHYLQQYTLEVEFNDGSIKEVDLLCRPDRTPDLIRGKRRDLPEPCTAPNPGRSLRFGPMNRAYGREDNSTGGLFFHRFNSNTVDTFARSIG
jgi:hypothetical protein